MSIFDRKFTEQPGRYLGQCGLATLAVLVILLALDALHDAAVVAALGASSFTAFAMPRARMARPRFMIGGYLIGMTAGSLCHLLTLIPEPTGWPVDRPILVASAAMAAGLTIFIMTVTETEHPPAASFAVGLALEWSWLTAVVAMAGIVLLVLIKELIKPRLCNLVDVADPEEQPPECPHSE